MQSDPCGDAQTCAEGAGAGAGANGRRCRRIRRAGDARSEADQPRQEERRRGGGGISVRADEMEFDAGLLRDKGTGSVTQECISLLRSKYRPEKRQKCLHFDLQAEPPTVFFRSVIHSPLRLMSGIHKACSPSI